MRRNVYRTPLPNSLCSLAQFQQPFKFGNRSGQDVLRNCRFWREFERFNISIHSNRFGALRKKEPFRLPDRDA